MLVESGSTSETQIVILRIAIHTPVVVLALSTTHTVPMREEETVLTSVTNRLLGQFVVSTVTIKQAHYISGVHTRPLICAQGGGSGTSCTLVGRLVVDTVLDRVGHLTASGVGKVEPWTTLVTIVRLVVVTLVTILNRFVDTISQIFFKFESLLCWASRTCVNGLVSGATFGRCFYTETFHFHETSGTLETDVSFLVGTISDLFCVDDCDTSLCFFF